MIKSSDDIGDECFDLKACEVAAREGDGISNERMVGSRGQSCNITTTGECALPNELSTGNASGFGFSVEAVQVVGGDVEFDFGHLVLVMGLIVCRTLKPAL